MSALSLAACGDPPGPIESYRAWIDHLAAGRHDAAYAGLSAASQEALAELARAEGVASGRALFLQRMAPPEIGSLAPLPRDASTLSIALRSGGAGSSEAELVVRLPLLPQAQTPGKEASKEPRFSEPQTILMEREEAGWKVHLKMR